MTTRDLRREFRVLLDRHFRTHYAELLRRWTSRAGGVDDAKDLIQSAYAAVYRAYAETGLQSDGEGALSAVLATSIRNQLIDKVRHGATRSDISVPLADVGHAPDADGDDAADFLTNVADETVATEDELAVRNLCGRVMAALSPHWRQVIALLLAERGPEDIGAIYGRDGHTMVREARKYFCRGLAAFKATDPSALWMGRKVCGWAA